jgi:hypothetical protein
MNWQRGGVGGDVWIDRLGGETKVVVRPERTIAVKLTTRVQLAVRRAGPLLTPHLNALSFGTSNLQC